MRFWILVSILKQSAERGLLLLLLNLFSITSPCFADNRTLGSLPRASPVNMFLAHALLQ